MFEGFVVRENMILEILKEFDKTKLDFILVGGYAVSAFQHRFSVDADLVVEEHSLDDFRTILAEKKFKRTMQKKIDSVYQGSFESYLLEDKLPVTVDLLVGSLTCRQTDGSWSFEVIRKNSSIKEIKGTKRNISVRIANKELLIAMKLHSARLTDMRDIVALCSDVDDEKIVKLAKIGNLDELKKNIDKIKAVVQSKNFTDSFKGVFAIDKVPKSSFEKALKLMERVV